MSKELLTESTIVLNASFKDKYEAIRAAGELLYQSGYVEEEYIADMLKREEIVTTYVGNGLSIPHGIANSEKDIVCSGLSFIQVPDGVAFGDEMAYIIIGIAGKNGEHLTLLGKIATTFCNLEKVEKLKKATTKKEILEFLTISE